jgi:hypothetical protein
MLDLPPAMRISTVTGWLADLDRHLADARYAHAPVATELRQEIREFMTTRWSPRKPRRHGGG